MSEGRCWVGVVSADHVAIAVRSGLCAFSHGARQAVSRLSPGDRFAFYSPRSALEDGEPVQAFTALGTVTGAVEERDWAMGLTAFVRPARYEAGLRPAPVRPLLAGLGFVRDPGNWGMAFRRGLFGVTAGDLALIETAMRAPT